MPIASHKEILLSFNESRWKEFIQDDDEAMQLPEVSIIPGRSASTRIDHFGKKYIGEKSGHHVKVITKNDEHAAFVWQTSPEKLKEAVRWGVVEAESITGKVIGALGQYRVAAHELILKGMISNTYSTKMGLLNLYQDRFELLQELESLANQENSSEEVISKFNDYIRDLQNMQMEVRGYYLGETDITSLAPDAIKQIESDIDDDLQRANEFIQKLQNGKVEIEDVNRGRGNDSVLEFVKTQMLHNLYELQGINQDMSYTLNRDVAFTRGRLNDYIEDARKEINDHQPDQRNLIGEKHHGFYNDTNTVIYDFSHTNISPENERKAMLAISFIEGWDELKNNNTVVNQYGEDTLKEIVATRWQLTRDFPAFVRKVGYTLLNMAKSLFVPTEPWIADTWQHPGNEDFKLVSDELIACSRKNKPVWHTPLKILKRLGTGIVDIFHGIYDAGKSIFKIPEQLWFDWHSTKNVPELTSLKAAAEKEIFEIKTTEEHIETELLTHVVDVHNNKVKDEADKISIATFKKKVSDDKSDAHKDISIAHQDYQLTAGETNDILNSAVRGLREFSEFFTHEFAKSPTAGAFFLATYGIAATAVLAPAYVSFLGPKIIAFEKSLGYTLGGSDLSAAIAAGSISGQVVMMAADGVAHGPGGMIGNVAAAFTKNPTELAVQISVAWVTGYLLAETGIPFIGPILHEEVKGNSLNYIILGAKSLLISQALFHKQAQYDFQESEFEFNGDEIIKRCKKVYDANKEMIERFKFIKWMSDNHHHLPKLSAELRCHLERYIDDKFDEDDANSLRKLINQEKVRTIAYQLLAIPLNYIPAFLRIIISVFVSIVAAVLGQPHPLQPIKNSLSGLYHQVNKDMSRLLIFGSELVRWVSSIITCGIKIGAFLVSMAASRLGAVVDAQSGHAFHRFFARAHVGLRKLGEFIYPSDVARDIVAAHPKSTVKQYESSYKALITKAFPDIIRAPFETDPLLDPQYLSGSNSDAEEDDDTLQFSETEHPSPRPL